MARHGSDRSEHWRRVIEDWRRSGQTVAEFCRRRRIASPTFYVWRQRLGNVSPSSRPSPAFLPVHVVPGSARPVLELALRGGRMLRLHGDITPEIVAGLVRALEGSPC